MKALTWHGKRDVRVDDVPDPRIEQPTDALVRITSTAICGSTCTCTKCSARISRKGDILGHEPMGIVEAVGAEVEHIAPGDRVVIPFNISCGHCAMCTIGLQSQCETTQVRSQNKGAALFGYTSLYGAVPGGQAELLRVPQAQYGPIKVASDGPDERYLFLSDILPTAWQGVKYADVPDGGTLAVIGLGPVGHVPGEDRRLREGRAQALTVAQVGGSAHRSPAALIGPVGRRYPEDGASSTRHRVDARRRVTPPRA